MKCSDVEKGIYLFDELGEMGRAELLVHLETCVACSRLYLECRANKELVREALTLKLAPPNSARITSNIMAGIHLTRKRTIIRDALVQLAGLRSWQAGLATVSLLLAGFFIVELRAVAPTTQPEFGAAISRSSLLDSRRFIGEIQMSRSVSKKGTLLGWYECVHACRQGRTEDCSACKIKFTKNNKANENM